jgi:ribosomal protein S18 acetylase RimI-like enzyme
VIKVSPDLVSGAAGAIAAGFFDNEIWMWMLPGDWRRRRLLDRHYKAMIRRVFVPRDGAWTTPDLAGAALWIPPARPRLTGRERFFETLSLLPEGLSALGRGARLDALMADNHPAEPHWYLNTLSVRPEAQRLGYGSALIEPGLAAADADGLPAYLETQREANIPFYRRFGFELTQKVSLPDSPPMWLMWRPGRS